MNSAAPDNPGWWVVRSGVWVAALIAAAESEYTVVDGFTPPVPGDNPPDGWIEDVPAGTLESFQVQAEIDGVAHSITFSLADTDSLIPINPRQLSGTAASTSTASGALVVGTAEISPDKDTDWLLLPGEPTLPEVAHASALTEANERLPVNAIAVTGSAASTSTASGTLSVASADISPDKDVEWLAMVGPEPLPEISLATLVAEHIPVNAIALTGTAASTSTASGTVGVAGADISPDPQVEWLAQVGPWEDPFTPAFAASDTEVLPVDGTIVAADLPPGEDEIPVFLPETFPTDSPDQELPVSAIALTGTAASASTASGTLSVSGADISPDKDTEWPTMVGPDALPEISLATLVAEHIPVSSIAITGTASSASTSSGVLAVAGVSLDVSAEIIDLLTPGAPELPEVSISLLLGETNERLPVNAVSLSGTAASAATASGTIVVAGVDISPDKEIEWVAQVGPPTLEQIVHLVSIEETNERLPVNPVNLSGSAASTATASGTMVISGADISPDKDIEWLALTGFESDHFSALLCIADTEVIPVDGTVIAGDQPPPEDDSFILAFYQPLPEWLGPYPEELLPPEPLANLSFHVFGDEISSGTVKYKVLGQRAPTPSVLTDIYTVPAATEAVVSTIAICNRTASPITYRLAIAVGSASDDVKQYIAYDLSLVGNSTKYWTLGMPLAATDVIRVYAAT